MPRSEERVRYGAPLWPHSLRNETPERGQRFALQLKIGRPSQRPNPSGSPTERTTSLAGSIPVSGSCRAIFDPRRPTQASRVNAHGYHESGRPPCPMFASTGSHDRWSAAQCARVPQRCSPTVTVESQGSAEAEPCVAFSLERLFRKNRLQAPSPDGIPFETFRVGAEILASHYFTAAMPVVEWHGYSRIEYGVEVKNYEIYQLLIPLSRSLCRVLLRRQRNLP